MYAIRVDRENWCRGTEAGWLVVTPDVTAAMLLQTQAEAEEALQSFHQASPQHEYAVQFLPVEQVIRQQCSQKEFMPRA